MNQIEPNALRNVTKVSKSFWSELQSLTVSPGDSHGTLFPSLKQDVEEQNSTVEKVSAADGEGEAPMKTDSLSSDRGILLWFFYFIHLIVYRKLCGVKTTA